MVQNDPAKKKLLGSKVEFFAFLLGISVQGHFVDIKRREGVGIRARGGLQSICNTKIHKILYSQVYPDLNVMDIQEKYR
jgi:hypothetical protein